MKVLVTGGNGDLGRRVVARLRAAGDDVLVGTRSPRLAGEVTYDLAGGLDPELLAGVDVLVHLATDALQLQTEVDGSARLWKAAKGAATPHVIYVSIVGVDRHPFPYYRAKRAVERQLEEGDLPYTIQRATQFHGLIPRFVDEAIRRFGFVPIPGRISVQPIDADVVAARIVELTRGAPAGRVPDLGGPEVLPLSGMVRDYLRATGRRVLRFRAPFWGEAVAAFRRGEHLAPEAVTPGPTYADYLAGLAPHRPDPVAAGLRLVAAALLATIAWMLVSPGGFHAAVASFGDVNTHFIRDTATFILPLALALWLAASRPAWRIPVLLLALLQNGLHIANHVIDVGDTDPTWHGPANLALLVVLEVVLGWLLVRQRRMEAPSPPPATAQVWER